MDEFNRSPMYSQLNLLPGAISEILVSVRDKGVLTLADRYALMAAAMDDSLSEEERTAVNRLLRAVCRGRIEVIEDLSVLEE